MRKLHNVLKRFNSFLVVSHTNLEGDAIGSSLALSRFLRFFGKKVTVVNADDVPFAYCFLPDIKLIKRPKKNYDFEAAIVIDCSDLGRIGSVRDIIPKEKIIVNIDHHIKNEKFAKVNLIDPEASSCCEIIYRLFNTFNVPIDKKVALLLYVGILTDTGSFRYPNTNAYTHKIVGELLRFKLPVFDIYQNVYTNFTFSEAKNILDILRNMRQDETGKIVYLEQRRRHLKLNSDYDISEYILDFARSIKDAEVVILFKELAEENKIRLNLRSKGRYDVNKLARFFGGGGHRTASGCNIKGNLTEVKRSVLKIAKQFLRR